ncbi:MAG: ABC transporter ATP-binding protein, partial [Pseudomonadales bacterium]|nr:ABC transporter ATP-binding protein [Pseudomonadales bacterium]
MKSLIRLLPFVLPYRNKILAGFVTFFIARFFEISVYYLVGKGIDVIGALANNVENTTGLSVWEVTLGIVGCVLMRFLFVVHARRAIRRVGISVSFDLRQNMYAAVCHQGRDFSTLFGSRDTMTRDF